MSGHTTVIARLIACYICILMAYNSAATEWLVHRAPLTEEGPIPRTQFMMFFIDDSEISSIGAFTTPALLALYFKSCPLLISTSLLRNIIAHKFYNTNLQALYKKLQVLAQSIQSEVLIINKLKKSYHSTTISSSILFSQCKLDSWSFYKINPYLYLLIPRQQLLPLSSKGKPKADAGSPLDRINNFTERELILGLKVDHLIEQDHVAVTKELIQEEVIQKFGLDDYLRASHDFSEPPDDYVISPLRKDNIFISRVEYKTANALSKIPQWTLLIGGHGLTHKTIAGLTMREFQALLDLFESKLLMRLAIIESCYVSGTNAVAIYNDLRAPQFRKSYSFPIINLALPDREGGTNRIKEPGLKIESASTGISLNPTVDMNISALPKILNEAQPTQYIILLENLNKNMLNPRNFFSVPLIRPAGRDRFLPLIFMLEIGAPLTKGRIKPMMVKSLLEHRQDISNKTIMIYLTTPKIPFTIDLTGVKQQITFVSGVPGPEQIIHDFSSLILGNKQIFTDITFLPAQDKLFYIKSIKQNDSDATPLYIDAITRDEMNILAYKPNNKSLAPELFRLSKNFDSKTQKMELITQKATVDDAKTYADLMNKINRLEALTKALKEHDYEVILKIAQEREKIPYQAYLQSLTTGSKTFNQQVSNLIFQQAIWRGDFLLAREAMLNGADVTNKVLLPKSPLFMAIMNKASATFIQELIQKGALQRVTQDDINLLMDFAENDEIKYLLKDYQKSLPLRTFLEHLNILAYFPHKKSHKH